MLNKVILYGRMVRDADIHTTESGVTVANFTIACERDWKPQGAETRETDFISCCAFRNTATFLSTYFKKGNLVCVEGRLQTRQYTDKEGNKRSVTEVNVDSVYFTGERKQSDSIPGGTAMRYNETRSNMPTRSAPAASSFVPDVNADDSDIPF